MTENWRLCDGTGHRWGERRRRVLVSAILSLAPELGQLRPLVRRQRPRLPPARIDLGLPHPLPKGRLREIQLPRHRPHGLAARLDDPDRLSFEAGIVCSMSRRGDCWDNAVAESFFATLKVELIHDAIWATRAEAHAELFEYLELFYNGQRRHSALGYLSPRAFERRLDHEASAA